VQLKLNEIVAALHGASNRLVDVERSSEDELKALRERYQDLTAITKSESTSTRSHSIEEIKSPEPFWESGLSEHAKKKD
jgi:low affinity Fe/Cu permease